MKRESFIVYKSFYALIQLLKPKEQLKMFTAIFDYGFDNTIPTFNDDASAAIWESIFPQLKANQKRYENSLKGGAPKNNQNATKKQPNDSEKNNQTIAKKTTENTTKKQPNENVNENVNVNDNDNVCFLKNRNKNLDECVDYFKKHFGEVTKEVRQGMEVFVYGGMDTDCILFAMQEAVDRGALSWQYVEGILNNWYDKGYRAAYDVVGETKIYKQNIVESYQDVKRRKEENTA